MCNSSFSQSVPGTTQASRCAVLLIGCCNCTSTCANGSIIRRLFRHRSWCEPPIRRFEAAHDGLWTGFDPGYSRHKILQIAPASDIAALHTIPISTTDFAEVTDWSWTE